MAPALNLNATTGAYLIGTFFEIWWGLFLSHLLDRANTRHTGYSASLPCSPGPFSQRPFSPRTAVMSNYVSGTTSNTILLTLRSSKDW